MAGPNLQAFFDQLLRGPRLGRAPGLGSGQAAAGPGVQPTAPAEGLRALMGTLKSGPWPGAASADLAANREKTRVLNRNAPGQLFDGLFNQAPFVPQRSDFQWKPPTGPGFVGDGVPLPGEPIDPNAPPRPLTPEELEWQRKHGTVLPR